MKRGIVRQRSASRESADVRFRRISKIIRERICILDYAPGTSLSEIDLAKEFGVSRTPLRHVLQRLKFEGLVDIKNGIGTIVTDINLKALKDTYDLRIRHALMVGELSPAPILDEHKKTLASIVRRLQALRDRRDIKEYARLANAYHEIFLQLIGNESLREVTDLLYYRVARIWLSILPSFNWQEEVTLMTAEFADTLKAMRRNDVQEVGRIRAKHLKGILGRMSRYIAQH